MPDDFDMGSALAEMADAPIFQPEPDERSEGGSPPPAQREEPAASPATSPEPGKLPTSAPGTPPPLGDVDPTAIPPAPAPEAPKSWKPEIAAKFATLDPVVQAEIQRREEDFHKGIETYKADANFGRPVREVMAPYLPLMQQHGIDPIQQVGALMRAHATLATGTSEQRQAMFQQLARDYNVTLQPAGEQPYTDPQLTALQQEIHQLKSTQSQREQREAQETRSRLEAEINTFASDKANEHFNAVAGEMSTLLKANPGMTLREAYDKAVWVNPTTRAALITRQTAEDAAKREKEAKEKAEAAAKATAAKVKTKDRAGSATTSTTGTMDDTLAETYRKIQARG